MNSSKFDLGSLLFGVGEGDDEHKSDSDDNSKLRGNKIPGKQILDYQTQSFIKLQIQNSSFDLLHGSYAPTKQSIKFKLQYTNTIQTTLEATFTVCACLLLHAPTHTLEPTHALEPTGRRGTRLSRAIAGSATSIF